jgi:hypothetical protein
LFRAANLIIQLRVLQTRGGVLGTEAMEFGA